jgi:hypothetical protein
MLTQHPNSNQDSLLQELLALLGARGIARKWAASALPYRELERECSFVASNPVMLRQFSEYLDNNKIIWLTVGTFLEYYSVAAFSRADQIPYPARLFAHRGVWINRWLPTFLVIDGPLGKLLRSSESPLNILLRTRHEEFTILSQARDLFNHDLFRLVRNGIAHWSFTFDGEGQQERLLCFDWKSGQLTVDVSVLEAEALNMASFSVIECLDRNLFRPAKAIVNAA